MSNRPARNTFPIVSLCQRLHGPRDEYGRLYETDKPPLCRIDGHSEKLSDWGLVRPTYCSRGLLTTILKVGDVDQRRFSIVQGSSLLKTFLHYNPYKQYWINLVLREFYSFKIPVTNTKTNWPPKWNPRYYVLMNLCCSCQRWIHPLS